MWRRSGIALAIGLALAGSGLQAQPAEDCEDLTGTPPGLYATTDEGRTFLIKDGQVVELAPGEAAFAGKDKLTCIKRVPEFLDWPCATDAAQSRKFSTYPLSSISSPNVAAEVVRRYFEVPEVIEPVPNWLEGESHVALDFDQIVQFSSADYWYLPSPARDILDPKRPRTLLISLYVGINQVVVDNYTVDALREVYAGKKLPVVFQFNDSNTVPVSYFGANVSLEEIMLAFRDRQIKLADVPMWQLGDHHLEPTAEEFEKLFDLPAMEDIDPIRREALAAQLDTYGYSVKPVFVTLLSGGERMYIDDPERVRVAIEMGEKRIPTVVNFVEQDDHLRRCGPGTPAGSAGVTGATTPIGGAITPPGVPAPEPEASES